MKMIKGAREWIVNVFKFTEQNLVIIYYVYQVATWNLYYFVLFLMAIIFVKLTWKIYLYITYPKAISLF